MKLLFGFKRGLVAGLILAGGLSDARCATTNLPSTGAVFATDANAGAEGDTVVAGAAAMVDGHVIPMDELIVTCLRKNRSYVVDQMIQGYVLDREFEKRGFKVSEAEIDQRIEELRKNLAPATLDETLKLHHMSAAELRQTFQRDVERSKLVEDQIRPMKMIHCREILVNFAGEGSSAVAVNRTEAEALARMKEIQEQIKRGTNFAELAGRYSESLPTDRHGDMGVLYGNMLGQEATVLTAAMALGKGEISDVVKTGNGYCLIEAVSTGSEHAKDEDAIYEEADQACRKLQGMFLGPKITVGLVDGSKIILTKDEELVAGKPLPEAAAVVDGHIIPMPEVVTKCLAETGPHTVDILVQNYIVDRECGERGITVSDGEIEERVDKLRAQMAPHTLEEGLVMHHTTLAGLRSDFRQEIERTKLVAARVAPGKMVHARAILIRGNPPGVAKSESGPSRSEAEARALLVDLQQQVRAGKDFAELASQFSEINEKSKGGDVGILYEGMHNMDTAVLQTALAMKKGEMSAEPIHANGAYFILQIISTSEDHVGDEDEAYAQAQASCREQKAQPLIPQIIVELIKKSKVVYYVHS